MKSRRHLFAEIAPAPALACEHLHRAVGGDPDPPQGVADGTADNVGQPGEVARELFVRFKVAGRFREPENLAVDVEADVAVEQKHLDPAFRKAVFAAERFDGGPVAGCADARQPGVTLLDPDRAIMVGLDVIGALQIGGLETLKLEAGGRWPQPAEFARRGVQPAPVARRRLQNAQIDGSRSERHPAALGAHENTTVGGGDWHSQCRVEGECEAPGRRIDLEPAEAPLRVVNGPVHVAVGHQPEPAIVPVGMTGGQPGGR